MEKVQPPKVGLMREQRALVAGEEPPKVGLSAAGEEGGDDGESRLGGEGCVTYSGYISHTKHNLKGLLNGSHRSRPPRGIAGTNMSMGLLRRDGKVCVCVGV